MTSTAPKAGSGPLFDWAAAVPLNEEKSGRSGKIPTAGSQEIIQLPTRAAEKSPDAGSESPEGPDLLGSFQKKANDSAQDPDPDFHPLRGGNGPDFFGAPSDPSAALTLRSQRTGQEGRESNPGDYKLNGPIKLRSYQEEALAAIEAEFRRGKKRTLAVLATGLGKTVLFADWAKRRVARGRRVLVIAHRTELLEQAQRKLLDVGVDAGIEQATRRARDASVVVASVQSLSAKRLEQWDPDAFDIVVDEAHHANATSYRRPLDYFPRALVLGVTATPDRGDGQALGVDDGGVWESLAYRYEIREGIRDKWLAPILARQVVLAELDLSSIRTRAGDLAEDQLAEVLAEEKAVLGQVDATLREIGDRRAIAFCVNVAHAKAIVEAMNRYRPGAACVAHGGLGSQERAQILKEFRRGTFQVLVNCELYTEGFDEPTIAAVVTLRPTKSRALVVQQVGRGTRLLGGSLAESIAAGKPNLLWLDVTGNAGRHKLVGPLDALAPGEIADDLRKEALHMLGEEARDLDEVLDAAAARLEERRQNARITVNAKYFATEIDPFIGAELLGPPCLEPWANDPATDQQRAQLQHTIKLKKIPVTITRGEAARIIAAHEERSRLGLASYAQQKYLQVLLRQNGYPATDMRAMSKAAASARIGILIDPDHARVRLKMQRLEADEMLAKRGGAR